MSGAKRKVLSFQQKREIIREIENGTKNIDVCRKFGLPSSSVSTVWRFRHKILALEDVSPTAKRLRRPSKVDVDLALMDWLKTEGKSVRITINLLKEKAEQIATDLGHVDFTCSNGWLHRFKTRHNVKLGRSKSAEPPDPEGEWLKMVWDDFLKFSYTPRDVYCAHEMGLFYDVTPGTSSQFKTKCTDGELSERRLTVLICCNMEGTHKRPLVVVGSSVLDGEPELSYVHNPNSWMTDDIFEKEIFLWDEELRQDGRKILVLVSSCLAHVRLNALEHIHLCFLPQEAPGLQPVDRGIARALRSSYRRQLLLSTLQDPKPFESQISLLDALRFLNASWASVSQETISRSFWEAGFITDANYVEPSTTQNVDELCNLIKQENAFNIDNLDDFELFDEGLATCAPEASGIHMEEVSDNVEQEDPPLEEPAAVLPWAPPVPDVPAAQDPLTSVKDAKEALWLLRSFFFEHPSSAEVSQALDVIHRNIDELGVIAEEIIEDVSSKVAKPNPCVGCLGLLQKPFCDVLLESILNGVDVSEYDATIFNVSMNLPSCYLLRSEALLVELRKHFPAFYKENIKGELLSLKDAFKACFGHLFSEKLNLTLGLSSGFIIDVEFKYADDSEECKPLCSLKPAIFTPSYVKKNGYSKNRIETVLSTVTDAEFSQAFAVPPAIPTEAIKVVKVSLIRESTNVAGRYNKFCRDLPQTPWLLNGERKMESSVEELISGPIIAMMNGLSSKFASSGREDVDVRSLGRGRPFNVEVLMPKTALLSFNQLRSLEKEIIEKSGGKLRISDLQIVPRESLSTLKQGEEEKTKEYMALCICPDGIPDTLEEATSKAPLMLDQSTPIRVLHRRPVANRQREILEMTASRIQGDSLKFKLSLKTQAGTYIKEFIHGDFGRTKPSLGELLGGVKVDILALDVTDVSLDWPPRIEYEEHKTNGVSNSSKEEPAQLPS